jgi:hypothetical protein
VGLNLYHFPGGAFHMSRFLGQYAGVMKLDVVTQVYAVLGDSLFLQMVYLDVLVVILDPDFYKHNVCP